MTGEPVMSTALVRREQPAAERAGSAAGVAELRRMVLMSIPSEHSKRNYAKPSSVLARLAPTRLLSRRYRRRVCNFHGRFFD
jgi:hypothetical protein